MAADSLRIVSYNVRYFGHALRGLASTLGPKRRAAAGLAALDPLPDVVLLQEVETTSLRSRLAHRAGRPGEMQLEAFMGRMEERFALDGRPMPYEAFYFRAHQYEFGGLPLYTTGLAVLVNAHTLRIDAHNAEAPHHITHHHVSAMRDRKQSRICAHLQLSTPGGRRFHVFNTHLSLPTPFAREFWATRAKMGCGINQLHEARTLLGFVHGLAGADPFVIGGDFNSPPASPVFRFLVEQGGLCCAQAECGQIDPRVPRGFPTAGFMHLRMHLDHLFSGGGVRWLDTHGTRPYGDMESAFFGVSDHMPLIARFQLA